MKSNEELMKNVLHAITWEPLLHAAAIEVIVKKWSGETNRLSRY
jgi:hypothetical protein